MEAGIVGRRKQGLNSYYGIADETVFELCDLVGFSRGAQGRGLGQRVIRVMKTLAREHGF